MKKIIASFLVVTVLSIGLISWNASGDGAVVIKDFGCILLDGDGNFVITDNSQSVITPSENGSLRCQANVPNSTGKAVVYKDLLCNTSAGLTTGMEVVSASGKATLTCHVNGQQ